jgi:hypothetical protein
MRDEPAVPQAGLVVLRLQGASALVAFFEAGSFRVDCRRVSGKTVDAEEVLDFLAGGVVHFGIRAQCLAREAALLTRVRHAGVLVGREACHGRFLTDLVNGGLCS